MIRHQQQVAAIVQKDPNVRDFMSSVGGGGNSVSNQGRLVMHSEAALEAPDERGRDREEPPAQALPGAGNAGVHPEPAGDPHRRADQQEPYQFTLQSTDIASLYQGRPSWRRRCATWTCLADVTSDLQIRNPQIAVKIDRNRAAALQVSARQIEEALYDAYGSRQVSTIFTPNNQYQVVMELMPEFQRDLSALNQLYIRSSAGTLVPLGAVATLSSNLGPLSVNHAGQIPAVTMSFNLKPRRLARRRDRRDRARRARHADLGHHHQLRGHRTGVPVEPAGLCWRCSCSPCW